MKKEDIKTTSRADSSRSKTERPKVWVPPSSLDAPRAPDGFRYRWIRAESVGFEDVKNIQGRIRSGYELVRSDEIENASDYPVIEDGKYKETPSPESKPSIEGRPLFKGSTDFTCLAFAMDLAKAFV